MSLPSHNLTAEYEPTIKYQTNMISVNIRIQLQQVWESRPPQEVWDSGVKFGFSGTVKRFFYQFGFKYFHQSQPMWVLWLAAQCGVPIAAYKSLVPHWKYRILLWGL